jgi:hypothetical protein
LLFQATCEPNLFPSTPPPGKLPKTVVPISYSIELRPDAESLALPGVEVIAISADFKARALPAVAWIRARK